VERLAGHGAAYVLLRRVRLHVASGAAPAVVDLRDLLPREDFTPASMDDHFIELAFVDTEGQPVPGVACRVELPDGRVRSARSNDAGTVRIEGIPRAGPCLVTFDPTEEADVARPEPPPVVPPATAKPATQKFVVTLVDEIGMPIEGAELRFSGLQTQAATTDAQGRVEIEGEAAETGMVEVDWAALHDELAARWDEVRPGELVEDDDASSVRLHADPQPVLLFANEPHVFSLQPRVDRFIATGLLFETCKAFLLPSALPSMRTIVDHHARMPDAHVLVVGHTDQAGTAAYNTTLSLERAEAMAAFLRDDVDAWLTFYEPKTAAEKRWGAHEDSLMLAALPDFADKPPGKSALRWFQETRGLPPDGQANPPTRRALVKEYMATDGTSLPVSATLTSHGCGESFPELVKADGQAAAENRRVEIFFFRPELGVQPPPPGPTSAPTDPQYPEWVRRARNTLEEDVEDAIASLLWHEGAVTEGDQPAFLIREVVSEQVQRRNAAIEVHDLSELGNELVVELGVHQGEGASPVRHRHRIDVGKLRAALRLGDQALLSEALVPMLEGGTSFGPLVSEPMPWQGEPITVERKAGAL
jgi:outer membrane protein OmpA-like peptidoglycan-associated protein